MSESSFITGSTYNRRSISVNIIFLSHEVFTRTIVKGIGKNDQMFPSGVHPFPPGSIPMNEDLFLAIRRSLDLVDGIHHEEIIVTASRPVHGMDRDPAGRTLR
jgi:hypothetical protein